MPAELTAVQATQALRRHVAADATCTAVRRGPIGNGQETWFLDVADAPVKKLVLRRTAEAGPLELTSRATEAKTMQAVSATGLPIPVVHAAVTDVTELGASFLIMDLIEGEPVIAAQAAERQALTTDLIVHLQRLHTAAIPDPKQRTAAQATRDEINAWRHHYVRYRVAPVPLVDALLAWCIASVPAPLAEVPAVLLWGDAGAHNALGCDGRVTGLLDWELSHAGHPVEDLASLLWIEGDDGVDASSLVAVYADAAGEAVDADVLRYFLALTCVTRSIMIMIGAAAFVQGRSHVPSLAGLGLDLPAEHLAAAAIHAGWGEMPQVSAEPEVTPGLDRVRPDAAEIDQGIARFLAEEVLPQVADPRTRRGVKTAVALLDTAAEQVRRGDGVDRRRLEATRTLLQELAGEGLHGDLATVAAQVEGKAALAAHRPRIRAHLLTDLALTRSLLGPLRTLYGRRA